MLLVIDIGNSNIVMGTYRGKKLVKHWRVSTDQQKTGDEYGILINSLFHYQNLKISEIGDIIISSVVPPLMIPFIKMCERYFNIHPMIVEPGIKTGIKLNYENPKSLGADRIVNVVGAFEQYGGPLIAIDIGTATTFDVISEKGDFLGGVIAPGILASAQSLFSLTSKLPRIELIPPEHIIGHSTISCMKSGIIYGYVSQIDGIVEKIRQEMGNNWNAKVIATGGLASMICKESKTINKVDHFLTLTGLRVLYERNIK